MLVVKERRIRGIFYQNEELNNEKIFKYLCSYAGEIKLSSSLNGLDYSILRKKLAYLHSFPAKLFNLIQNNENNDEEEYIIDPTDENGEIFIKYDPNSQENLSNYGGIFANEAGIDEKINTIFVYNLKSKNIELWSIKSFNNNEEELLTYYGERF